MGPDERGESVPSEARDELGPSGPMLPAADNGPLPLAADNGLDPLGARNGPTPLDASGGSGPRHPEGDLLDAYADGERTPGSVDRHVRGCAVCQQTVVALRGVRVELARLAPVSMPPDVARRIQEALTATPLPSMPPAGEGRRGGPARRRPAGGRSAGRPSAGRRRPTAPHGVTPLRPPDRSTVLSHSQWSERLVLLAVCLLVVVAGGGLVVALQHNAQSSSSTSSSAAGPAIAADQQNSADSAARAAVPSAVAAAPTPEGLVTVTDGGSVQSFRVATSRAALDPANVAAHARDLLAGRVPGAETAPFAASDARTATGAWAVVATPALLACYRELVDTAHGPLLAVDEVNYRGRDAILVVLDLPDGGSAVGTASASAAAPVGPASAAPGAALVPASQDRIQLTVVDLDCNVGRLPAATLFDERSTKAA